VSEPLYADRPASREPRFSAAGAVLMSEADVVEAFTTGGVTDWDRVRRCEESLAAAIAIEAARQRAMPSPRFLAWATGRALRPWRR
jgi:hypothetical protein